ncbi:MAG TPA: Crp/Fnr family transcriptional regulator [Elusimicrobiota bacterium]|nr:Crp/Fnr family transcriptional regulator [Elusimicrobiota bacterium]
MNIASFLKQIPLFHCLGEADLRRVARITKVREARKGETIFTKDTWGDCLYIVVSGVVKIFSMSRTGKTKTFALLESRDFFGEMALLERGERSAGAVAATPAVLLTIHRRDFQKLVKDRPQVAFVLLRTLCDRLRRADRDIEALSFNSVVGRVSGVLLDLAKRYAKKGAREVRIDMDISHQELADMAGTAREMVTRVLNRFVRLGCLRMDGKRLTLLNVQMLRDWIF